MSNLFDLSNDELRELVKDGLEELGVEPDTIDIEVVDESSVLLRGKAGSRREKELIGEAVENALGVDEVLNELRVARPEVDEAEEEDDDDTGDVIDDDDDTVGTEDLTRSVEDGIPYMPPVKRVYREARERPKARKNDGRGTEARAKRRKRG